MLTEVIDFVSSICIYRKLPILLSRCDVRIQTSPCANALRQSGLAAAEGAPCLATKWRQKL